MKYIIMPSRHGEKEINICNNIKAKLELLNQEAIIDEIYDDLKDTKAIIAVGGDGSIIRFAKLATKLNLPVLGVNCGRLAFNAAIENNELDLLEKLVNGEFYLENRLMLKIEGSDTDGNHFEDYCLNDCIITNEEKQRLSEIDVYFNNNKLNSYLCDAIIIATPTGSTAYSLSAGGPVVEPNLENIVFTPVCPHSLFNRSIIFKKDTVFSIGTEEGKRLCVSSDGNAPRIIASPENISVTCAPFYARFIKLKPDSFIDILYSKLQTGR